MKSVWKEIRNNNYDDIENCITIDAWKTGSDSEEGVVIARLYGTGGIDYYDRRAKTDEYAQEIIKEAAQLLFK